MQFINCTPHVINLNDGSCIEPSGNIARVESSYTSFDSHGVASIQFGPVLR